MNVLSSFTFDFPISSDTQITNSCNGLLCIIEENKYYKTSYVATIINPMTNEYVTLPGYNEYCLYFGFGLGFSSKSNEYKFARIFLVKNICGLEILTLGKSNEWRHVSYLPILYIDQEDGIYFNGVLYWICIDKDKKIKMLCLDVEEESFSIIDIPKLANSAIVDAFDDGIYVSIIDEEEEVGEHEKQVEVWKLGSCASNGLWTLWFVVNISACVPLFYLDNILWKGCSLKIIKICESGEIFFLLEEQYLLLYDLKTQKITKIHETEDSFSVFEIKSPSFNSLRTIFGS